MGPASTQLLLAAGSSGSSAGGEQPLLLPLLPCGTAPSRTLTEEQATTDPAEDGRLRAAGERMWGRQFTEPRARDAFLQVFLSLLGHYRIYVPAACGGLSPTASAFEEAEFTKHEKKRRIGGRSSRGRAKQALLSVLVKTQMFEQFIVRRMQAGRAARCQRDGGGAARAPAKPRAASPGGGAEGGGAEGGGEEGEGGGGAMRGFEGHSGAGGALPREQVAAGLDFFDRCAELRQLDEKSRRRSMEASATERRSSLVSLRSEEGGVLLPMPPPPPPAFLAAAPTALPALLILDAAGERAEAEARAAEAATTPSARLVLLQQSQLRASHSEQPGSLPAQGAPNIQWAGALGPADRARVGSMFQSRPSVCAVRAGVAIKRHTPEFVADKVPHDRAPHAVTKKL